MTYSQCIFLLKKVGRNVRGKCGTVLRETFDTLNTFLENQLEHWWICSLGTIWNTGEYVPWDSFTPVNTFLGNHWEQLGTIGNNTVLGNCLERWWKRSLGTLSIIGEYPWEPFGTKVNMFLLNYFNEQSLDPWSVHYNKQWVSRKPEPVVLGGWWREISTPGIE